MGSCVFPRSEVWTCHLQYFRVHEFLARGTAFSPRRTFSVYVRKINVLFEKRHREYASQPLNSLPKNVQKKLTKSIQQASTLHVKRNTRSLFEVLRLNHPMCFRVVDTDAMKCSCRFFEEHGIPCRHLCAAVLFQKRHPQELVVHERLLPALIATYDGFTVPVDSTLLRDGLPQSTNGNEETRAAKGKADSFLGRECPEDGCVWSMRWSWPQYKSLQS